MDDAMIGRLLQTYGAPTTVRNANAARQFFATNPEIAEKRAMGMRGSGIDDNSDIFGAQLDKFIEASSTPQQQITQSELPPIETVQAAARPTRKAATAGENKTYPNPNEASGSPNNPGSGPITRDVVRGGKGFGVDDMLIALLGLSSTAGRAVMGGRAPAPDAPKQLTYQPVDIPDPNVPQVAGNDGVTQKRLTYDGNKTPVTSDPALTTQAKKAQLQAEIDAENADAQKLQDQLMERNKRQTSTRDLLKSAKRTITGR